MKSNWPGEAWSSPVSTDRGSFPSSPNQYWLWVLTGPLRSESPQGPYVIWNWMAFPKHHRALQRRAPVLGQPVSETGDE